MNPSIQESEIISQLQNRALASIAAGTPLEGLHSLCQLVEELVEGSNCSTMIFDAERDTIKFLASPSAEGLCGQELVVGMKSGSCGAAAFTGQPVYVADTRTDSRWTELQDVVKAYEILSCWSIPIKADGARILGTFAISRKHPSEAHEPTPLQKRILVTASYLAGLALARIRLEEESLRVERAVQRAKSMECLGLLAGGVAHDFNNMLVAIHGSADLIEIASNEHEIAEHVERIRSAANQATGLCRKLLMYAGQDETKRVVVSLNEIIQEIVQLHSTPLGQGHLEVLLDSSSPAVLADPVQLRQVTLNLVVNAIQALPAKGGVVRVRTGTQEIGAGQADHFILAGDAQTYAFISIEDNGGGIPARDVEKVFTPFYTTKKNGSGLGLAAVLGTVRDHGGMLNVESAKGAGTTFTAYFPSVPEPATRAFPEVPCAYPSLRGKSVLIVDDDAAVQRVLTNMFEHAECGTRTADNGQEALEILTDSDETFDLVVLDFGMPVMSGLELIHSLRGTHQLPPTLLSSGNCKWPAPREGEEFELLQKPYGLSDVLGAAESVLCRSSQLPLA